MIKGRVQAATAVVTALSRLLLFVAVALFAAHHVVVERNTAPDSPVAAVESAFAPVILTAQIQPIRASVPEGGDTPHAVAFEPRFNALQQTLAPVLPDPFASGFTLAITILPPVRAPPEA